MSKEQLGTGNTADQNTVAGDLLVGGGVAFNGVTTVPEAPTITTLPVTATTADIASMGTAINSIISALDDLGLVNQ